MNITHNDTRGSVIVYWSILIMDIVIMTLIFSGVMKSDYIYTPNSILFRPRAALLICVFTAFIAETVFPPVVHRRRVYLMEVVTRVCQMSFIHIILFAFIEKIYMGTVEGLYAFLLFYAFACVFSLLIIRAIERVMLNYFRRSGRNSRAVVFIGSDEANGNIIRDMAFNTYAGYRILGYISNNKLKNAPEDIERILTLDEFILAISRGEAPINCDEVYCSLSHNEYEKLETIIRYCDSHVIRFFFVPRIYGYERLNLTPIRFGNITIFTNHNNAIERIDSKIVKRIFDIVFSITVLSTLLPFVPLIWLIIRCQSPGPLFFGQMRTGLDGKPFRCWKFRSMHVNSASDTQQATKDDPRKFPFGNFMRRTNIDELPQFFNVLIGNMSVVGPRPHMLRHTDIYSGLIDKYMVRHFSKPGITGWAQVTGFRGETRDLWQMEERIKHDIWYYEHWSFILDIKIILLTIKSVIKPDKNAY